MDLPSCLHLCRLYSGKWSVLRACVFVNMKNARATPHARVPALHGNLVPRAFTVGKRATLERFYWKSENFGIPIKLSMPSLQMNLQRPPRCSTSSHFLLWYFKQLKSILQRNSFQCSSTSTAYQSGYKYKLKIYKLYLIALILYLYPLDWNNRVGVCVNS